MIIKELAVLGKSAQFGLYPSKQFGEGDFEGACDFLNIDEGDISLAPLNGPHVRAVETATVGEFFLGETRLLPSLSDCPAKSAADVFHRLVAVIVSFPQPIRLQTMSSILALDSRRPGE